MYHTLRIQVKQGNPLYVYLEQTSHLANNLYNAGLFRCRQLITAAKKDRKDLAENEKEVIKEFSLAFPDREKYSSGYVSLDRVMRVNHNPDFFAEGLSKQTAQHVLKQVARDVKGFFESLKAYKQNPSAFTGKPNIPGYHKKGGLSTITFTNQDCVVHSKGGTSYLKFPGTKEKLDLGTCPIDGRLKEVKAKPYHNIFIVYLAFDDGKQAPVMKESPERVCAIDFGVENLAAITNNVGLPCLLFKGGVLKSQNQWYNKRMAEIVSKQTTGTTDKFVPTPESQFVCLKRENQVIDFSRKLCKRIVDWCVENEIDTIVAGRNKYWKQDVNLGHEANQEFVQLPFGRVIQMLELKALQYGIRVVKQEESYTSQASYPDNDPIPVYGVNDSDAVFSGERKPCKYKGMKKEDGFRGLYRTKDGTIINSDLNGSANIGRKAFPELFTSTMDFSTFTIIKHPDYDSRKANREKQDKAEKKISKSKARRLAAKSSEK
ncbi:MAG: RNA-guided endonuclease InsQ/TnpB family protein [Acetatifactor sp.]